MVQRIDANTEDVVDNVEGAQKELMKYWSRVSGNRWLVAKMFGVLMVRLPFPQPITLYNLKLKPIPLDLFPPLGPHRGMNLFSSSYHRHSFTRWDFCPVSCIFSRHIGLYYKRKEKKNNVSIEVQLSTHVVFVDGGDGGP